MAFQRVPRALGLLYGVPRAAPNLQASFQVEHEAGYGRQKLRISRVCLRPCGAEGSVTAPSEDELARLLRATGSK